MLRQPFFVISAYRLLTLATYAARLYLLEEVVTLVIDQDEGWEVLYANLPYRLHTQLGELYALDRFDVLLGEQGCRTSDRAQVEATVLATRVGYLL